MKVDIISNDDVLLALTPEYVVEKQQLNTLADKAGIWKQLYPRFQFPSLILEIERKERIMELWMLNVIKATMKLYPDKEEREKVLAYIQKNEHRWVGKSAEEIYRELGG